MAFNWPVFRTRALTAIVFAAVMLAGLLWNHWSFLLLFSIIHFGCWWEYFKLAEKIHNTKFHPYTKLGIMVFGYHFMLLMCGPAYVVSGFGLSENIAMPVSAAGLILILLGIFSQRRIHLRALGMAALGLLYISLSWGLMINLYQWTIDIHLHDTMFVIGGGIIPIIIIASIWINDTMAYIVGSLIGKTPLSKVSPKKTWEGTIGGVILAVVVVALLSPAIFFKEPFTGFEFIFFIALIALITAITGTIGDLLESKLKRMADVKDSGSLMPGHGGFLDRFDSLLLATPFVWVFVKLLLL
ncbi:MAG: phosphatidate cytidylyltransferase [Chitinophagales bacterium]|nr:phosphatidate cytidylyltransferase [Chitinophagales bacterium]